MSFPRYLDYKDSGVEWLGEVPGHWHISKIKWLFRFVKRQDGDDAPVLSVYRNYGVIEKSSRDDNNNKTPEDLSLYQTVQVGDLVINKMKAWQGSLGVSDLFGITSPDYAVFEKVHDGDGRFLHHLLRSRAMPGVYQTISNGIRPDQWRLEPDKFGQLLIPLPPVPEQSAIAAFLDRETAKIDALVAEQETLIELLKEKRQAVISHAVTKGLDPSVPMKDSGIEWLGEVPAHWVIVRLKRMVMLQRGHDLSMDEREEGDVPVISSGGAIATHNVAQANGPGIVTGRYGTIGKFVFVEEDYWPLNTALYSIELNGSPRFLWYMLQSISEHFIMNSLKSAVPGVDRNDVHTVFVARPPDVEQEPIVTFLDDQTAKFDALTAEAQRAIELLKEHRSALISAAVTGKIDVRTHTKENSL